MKSEDLAQIIIRKRTLELLLKNSKSIEDLDLVEYAIQDYKQDGYYYPEYLQKVKELREGFWG